MLSKRMVEELNLQVKYELYSAHMYLAMEAYCAANNLDGSANWLKVQHQEEQAHARFFIDYINRMNGEVKILGLEEPNSDFESILDVYKKGYAHEQFVTSRIYHLSDISIEEKDHATGSFLKWFVDEQVEEEANFLGVVKKLEMIDGNTSGLYILDKELAARVFIPPVMNV